MSPSAISVSAAAIIDPPRQTPHSTIAPGIRCWLTYCAPSQTAAIRSCDVIEKGSTRRIVRSVPSSNPDPCVIRLGSNPSLRR